jgi:hypothetical protein
LQWYTEGVPKLKISQKAGVSRNCVKSSIRQFIAMDKSLEELVSLTDAELEKLFIDKQVKEPRIVATRSSSGVFLKWKRLLRGKGTPCISSGRIT